MSISTSRPRLNHCPLTASGPFLNSPGRRKKVFSQETLCSDFLPTVCPLNDSNMGTIIDVSDRMLICCSSNMRNEIVVGGADHALYAIDVQRAGSLTSSELIDRGRPVRPTRKPFATMYSKTCGHTDWVTR